MSRENDSKALKSGIWYTVGNFTTKAMGFLSTPIFTRLLSTKEVGDYSNFTSWVTILVVLTTLDLYSSVAVARFDFRDDLNDYIASNLLLGSSITFCFYVIAIVFKDFFLNIFGFSEFELHLAFLYFMVYPAMQMFQMKSRIQYKYKLSVALSLISAVSATGISLIAVLLCENRFIGRLGGYYIPLIITNVFIYAYIIKSSERISTKYWKYAVRISIPLVWHTLSANLLSSSDRIMIKSICGSTDTAFYSVAYSCAMIVSVLWNSLNTAWSPWAYEKMDEKDFSRLKSASRPYMLFFGAVVFCFLLVAPEILWLMGGDSYSSALMVIPPVMVAYVFQFAYSLYVNIEIYSKKQNYIAIGTTIAAIVNIGLNAIFIPIFGYTAAAYTTLAGYVVLFLIHYLFAVKLKRQWWYDTKFNFVFLLVFLALSVVFSFVYKFTVIRWTIIIILFIIVLAVIVKLRNEITESLKTKSLQPIMKLLGEFKNDRKISKTSGKK